MNSTAPATRYLIRTARGFFRSEAEQRLGVNLNWTRFPEEAQEWVDVDRCHAACRQYTKASGESAVVVVTIRPTAISGRAIAATV